MFRFKSRLLLSRVAIRRPGYQWVVGSVRYQSKDHKQEFSFNDEKLKQIIESLNFGVKPLKRKLPKELIVPEDKPSDKATGSVTFEAKQAEEMELIEKLAEEKELIEKEAEEKELVASLAEAQEGPLVKEPEAAASEDRLQKLTDSIHHQIKNLPSQREKLRYEVSKKLEIYLDSLQETILTATRALNDVTGYSAIEKLKKSIEDLESEMKAAKDHVKSCKELYAEAILRRSTLQKEMNDLLTRKNNWSSADLERFTELYRNDHTNEQEELITEENLNLAESQVDAIQLRLTQLILTRYHEEQIWSDKIRRASTWGTWILMGINIFLFMIATFFVEPWKRRRMVGSFEDKVKQAIVELQEKQAGQFDEFLDRTKEPVSAKEIAPAAAPVTTTPTTEPPQVQVPVLAPLAAYKISLGLPESWHSFQHTVSANFHALFSAKDIETVQFNKPDLAVAAVTLALAGYALGALTTALLR